MGQLVITAVGPDRPGLVDELTGFLNQRGSNIADSRMINLRGQFALILLVEGDDTIDDSIIKFGKTIGLTVMVADQSQPPTVPTEGLPYRLRTYAMDQPGIVHRITHVLHKHSVNIEELQTRLQPGSYSSPPLFSMDMKISIPSNISIKQLRGELTTLCESLNCDVELEQ